jgi:predicted ester cyclase
MEETMIQPDLLSTTKKNLEAYFETHDAKYVAEDGVFINLATGERTEGREAVGQLLHHIYHVAFDAHAEVSNKMISTDRAMVEGVIVGKHIGEFAGIAPTQKNIRVPLCVTYNMKDGLISEARIYMMVNVLIDQLTGK